MASHFSTIGIPVTSNDEFIEYLKRSYEYGEKIKTDKGTYLKWELGNGVELWGQIDTSNNPIGLNPYFKGQSRTRVKVESLVYSEDNTVLDGAFRGWASCDNDDIDGTYPFVIDVPNMAMYENIKIPQFLEFQITAFAHEIKAYSDDEEFNTSQNGELKFAAESFIPSGLFSPNGESTTPPEALAIFNGHIVDVEELINPITNNRFLWTLVKTLGAEYDVVIDPSILKGELKVGGVISGSFWLTGVIISDFVKKETSLFKRLFNKRS
jgi:hypothetical protein